MGTIEVTPRRAEVGVEKYTLLIFGCQMNFHDAEVVSGILEQMGYEKTDDVEASDLILLVTCSIRESAVDRVFGQLGALKRLKYQNPDLILGICGCLPQQEGAVERLKKRAPFLDLIFGTHNIHQLPELVERARSEPGMVVDVWESEGDVVEHLPSKREDGLKAMVTIMYGCNNYCAYCVVPYTRGRERSRRPSDIIHEITELGRIGFKEVMLLGQNVNSYGKDLDAAFDFADLLSEVDRIPGIERIRYMTSHPRDFTQKLIDVIAASDKVCEHFHLPVQAGSNAILRLMNRGYSREAYLDLVRRVRDKVPEAAITTDFIVGFPGETSEQFEETLDLIETVRFDSAYTFMFSARTGTPAATMEGQLSAETKRERLSLLMQVQNRIGREINEALEGQVVEVLVEGPSKKDPAMLSGRTRTNKLVLFPGDPEMVSSLVNVRIDRCLTWTLSGEAAKF
jgi:tRNA-2-methylthio-N6-dimethylallyladenosine synthase